MNRYLREMAESGYTYSNIPAFHRVVYPYLAEKLLIEKGSSILEIGAGQGHCIIPLIEKGWKNISVVDIDDTNFPFFQSEYGINCYQLDLNQDEIPIADASFEYIQASHVIEHLASPDNFLREISRLLRPMGRLVIVTPDWKKWWRDFYSDPTHLRPFDKEGIARLLRMYGFHNIKVTSFGARAGLGRSKLILSCAPQLCFIGRALMVTATK